MLKVTDQAVAALNEIQRHQGVPETFGVRVYGQPTSEGTVIGIAFAEEPEEGDDVAETSGTKVFVAPEVSEPLADSMIDAEDTPEGVRLVVKGQD